MPIGDNIKNKKMVSELFRVANKIKVGLPIPPLSGGLKRILSPTNWAETFWGAAWRVLLLLGIEELVSSIISAGIGAGALYIAKTNPEKTMEAIGWVADEITQFEGVGTELAGITVNQMTGAGLDIERMKLALTLDPISESRRVIGEEFTKILPGMFDIEEARQSFLTRTDQSAFENNLNRYFGTNLSFQMRSMVISTISSLFAWAPLRHLEQLHQSVNWSYGFGWLSWTVLSAIMDVTTTQGLKRKYNAIIKPGDYTDTEARWAYWSGNLAPADLGHVLDNAGVRDDVRASLLARAEADLTETDLVDFWQHQRLPEADILKQYRLKGFGETKATLKKDRVVDARLWDLLDKIDVKYGQLYRDCVVDKIEYQQWLQSRGWSANEQDAVVAFQELDRRSRKWLEKSDLDKLLDAGVLSVAEVTDYLICQGMTELDAAMQVLLFMTPKIPKAKLDKCAGKSIDDLIADLLSFLLKIGGLPLSGGLLAWLKCLLEGKVALTEEPPAITVTSTVKLPTGGLSTLPSTLTVGEQYRLVWNIERSDRQEIDNDIGPVGPQGTLFLTADHNRVYHLIARNADGERDFQSSILVRPKPAPGPVKVPAPTISFSISPPRALVGDQIAIQWETHNASQVFLDDGLGLKAVPLSGARFGVADQSRVFTLTAAGLGGQRQRSDTIVVRPSPEERIPIPQVHLSISPSRVQAGDEVEVKWSTANASLVYLEGLAGREQVTSSGIRIIKADVDRVITLRASSPEFDTERIAQETLIVEAPPTAGATPELAPSVSLTLRPSKAKKGQQVAVEWRTTHAERVTIEIAGNVVTVGPVGGDTFTAHETDTIILHAYGKDEERAIAKVIIVE